MSRRQGKRGGIAEEDYFEADDVYIVEIRHIEHPLMRTLAAHFYSDHFPPGRRGDLGSIAEAKETWNRDPRFIDSDPKKKDGGGGGSGDGMDTAEFEQEMPDVEAVLDEVLSQDSRDYNAQKQDMYDRHRRAVEIGAQCLVRYTDPHSGGVKHALVRGKWWTLSKSVPLCVRGKQVYRSQLERRRSGADAELELIDAGVFGGAIYIAQISRVSGAQFYHLLIENGNFAPAEAREHVIAVFTEPSHEPEIRALNREVGEEDDDDDGSEDSLGIRRNPVNGGAGMTVPVTHREMREQQSALVRRQRITVSGVTDRLLAAHEVAERCQRLCSETVQRQMQRAPFIALGLRALLLHAEYHFIEQCYAPAVQIEALMRGVDFTAALAKLLNTQPWVLCIHQLRCEFAAESHIAGLRQLPDLAFAKFIELLEFFKIKCDIGVRAGVDIYHNILRRDVYGYDTHREARSADGAFSYTSGHMFSVFGADRSHFLPQYYHRGGVEESGAALQDPDSLSHSGLFALPWAKIEAATDSGGEEQDAALVQPPADELDFANEARALPLDVRENMRLDLGRLRYEPARNYAALMRGLHWLIDKRVVVVERFVGSGPHNRGRKVDAFFLAQVHQAQCSVVRRLVDMSTRATFHSRWTPPTDLVNDDAHKLFSEIVAAEERWRKDYTPAVKQMNKAPRNAATGLASNAALHARDAAAQAAPNEDNRLPHQTAIGQLAMQIAKEEAKFEERYALLRAEQAKRVVGAARSAARVKLEDRAYAEARDATALGAHRTWPLQHVAQFSRRLPNKQRLAREQIEALERVQKLPIVQISGAGGVGKSELISQICAQYPPEQVMLTSFTGQVASELARRTGRPARTIHSLLFLHARYLKARFRTRAFSRARAAKREADGAPDPRNLTLEQMRSVSDARELREYVEHHCASQPPFASPFQHVRVLIIDEISLVAFLLFCRLFEAAHAPEQGRFLEKLVLVGDLNQLPPIGFGSIQSDMAHGLPHSVAQLVINHRSSGTQLFQLAQEVARHDHKLSMPEFSRAQAHRALGQPAGNDIVAYEMTTADIADDLRNVYEEIGADEPNSAIAQSTQCLATTNATINRANETVRELYFVEPQMKKMRAELERAAGIGSNAMVQANSAAQKTRRSQIASQVEEARATMLRRLPMKIYRWDRFFVRKNQRRIVSALRDDEQQQVIEFYNGRLLVATQFYDAPRRIQKNTFCRCGLCVPPAEGDTEARGLCMMNRAVPPPARCGPPRTDGSDYAMHISFHDEKAPTRRDTKRRMVVARDESNKFTELDIESMLVPRSKFGFGFALTTHKMQGSQARYIVYVCTNNAPYITWKHVYTALTRARERVIIMSESHIFEQLVRRKAPVRRSNLWLHLHRALATLSPQIEPQAYWRTPKEWFAAKKPLSDYPHWPEPINSGAEAAWSVFEELRQAGAVTPQDTNYADGEASLDEDEVDDDDKDDEEEDELERQMVQAAERVERQAAASKKRKETKKAESVDYLTFFSRRKRKKK